MDDGGGGASGASSSNDRTGKNRNTAGENTNRSSAALDGAFLLQLLRNPPLSQPKTSVVLPHESLHPHRDPAVAAIGPSYPFAPHSLLRPPPPPPPPHPLDHFPKTLHFSPPPTSLIPPGYHRDHWAPPDFPPGTNQQNSQFQGSQQVFRGDFGTYAAPSANDLCGSSVYSQRDGVSSKDLGLRGRGERSMLNPRMGSRSNADSSLAELGYWKKAHPMQSHVHVDRNHYHGEKGRSSPSGNQQHAAVPRPGMVERGRPLGSLQKPRVVEEWVPLNEKRAEKGEDSRREEQTQSALQRKLLGSHESDRDVHRRSHLSHQFDRSGGAFGRNLGLIEGSDIKRSLDVLQHVFVEEGDIFEAKKHIEQGEWSGFASKKGDCRDSDSLAEQLEDSIMLRDDPVDNNVVRHSNSSRGKDVRFDLFRGHHVSSQRLRIRRREMECRSDIESLAPSFLSIYKSLIPADQEKVKQKQLLLSLGELVNKEWPHAQLHLYGSCANSFGVSNSDIDICLAIDDSNMSKPEILLKLADILQSDNLQNVQALTHARVPIVKMMDPVTGISCDICINNLLAVINTKLLRDYAQIDDRLRQLAFIVKHWAKSRGVNETYRGTLSSYAYVLMCIHFLQLRKPAILPCLQEMEATYVVTVDDTQCAYFDQVDRLRNFGAPNKESIALLLWGFFHYWAYFHDYMNDVISVRTGRIISKQVKDWTRRIGNDRHLICIEDPFETSHDLGRVVDKYSIKILREEFERAADILQYDPNPSVTLFEPYVPWSAPNGLQLDSK